MAAAVADIADLSVGDTLEAVETGGALTHAATFVVALPGPNQPSLTCKGTTSGAGALNLSSIADIQVNHEGEGSVTFNDGTTTVVKPFRVWRSG